MREMADKYNVTAQSWSRWEYGDAYPRTPLLMTLAEDIGCTVAELIQSIDYTSKVLTRNGRGKDKCHA